MNRKPSSRPFCHKFRASRGVLLLLACGLIPSFHLTAEDAAPPPPPDKKPPQDQPHRQQGMHPMFPGIMPRGENADMFKQLPEADRARVRAAFEKAWSRPDVLTARENLNRANEDFRKALHNALQEADPEVVKILEKVKPLMPGGFYGRMPDVNEPDFSKRAEEHLGAELQNAAKRDGREGDTQRMHQRLMAVPQVSEAIHKLEQAHDPQQKMEAWRQLREAYFTAMRQEIGGRIRNGDNAKGRLPGDAAKPAPDDGAGKN